MSVTNVPVPAVPVEAVVREPFDTFYHREFRGLVRLAMVLVDSQEQAEEVVQDAFAALYLRYDAVTTPLAYIRASVLNGSRKVLRRRGLSRRLLGHPQPDSEMVYNHVIDAVRRLPARQRAAVVLRYELQLTDGEIAETLKVPLGTVKSTLHRAIAQLRQEIPMTDLDPLLHDAIARVRGPVDTRPSLADVRRRARRHNRRRMTATVGVVACTGVATAALIIRRDSAGTSSVASAPIDSLDANVPTTTMFLSGEFTTTTTFGSSSMTITPSTVWDALFNARFDPSGAGLIVAPADQAAADVMPTPEQFGCTTPECRAMYNYVVWHEIAVELGFSDMRQMQDMNSAIDLSQPPVAGDVLQIVFSSYSAPPPTTIDPNNETPTTLSLFDGVVLIDGGAPAGAMEDAYQRLPGYNRVIVPSSGKTVEQTMVMPIGDNTALASAVGGVFGIDGFDTWDPSFIGTAIQGMVAVVIGPDYFDLVQGGTATVDTTATTSTISETTSAG